MAYRYRDHDRGWEKDRYRDDYYDDRGRSRTPPPRYDDRYDERDRPPPIVTQPVSKYAISIL